MDRFRWCCVVGLVRELNGSDNLFFEIQNEPWADNHVMGEVINPYLTDRYRFPTRWR